MSGYKYLHQLKDDFYPFFQSSLVLSLPCIEEPVYRKFANRLLSSQHRVIDESVFSYIYQQSGSVTWYLRH